LVSGAANCFISSAQTDELSHSCSLLNASAALGVLGISEALFSKYDSLSALKSTGIDGLPLLALEAALFFLSIGLGGLYYLSNVANEDLTLLNTD